MAHTFKVTADIQEINRYDFEVEASTEGEARDKVEAFLKKNAPYPYLNDSDNGVRCTDREPAMDSGELVKISSNN